MFRKGAVVTLFGTKRYQARYAQTKADVTAAQGLRARCFDADTALDADAFDDLCAHILIFDRNDNSLVCCFRLLPLSGNQISDSYSAQFYELSAFETYTGKMIEMGRFCVSPDVSDPDVLRVAWAAMTTYVDEAEIDFLFGCSSFTGTESAEYLDAFAVLKAHHLAPKRWLPRIKAPDVFKFTASLRRKPDVRKAMMRMPPLLRSYLMMGGWVSDHAVVDRKMNTLHVFTV